MYVSLVSLSVMIGVNWLNFLRCFEERLCVLIDYLMGWCWVFCLVLVWFRLLSCCNVG